MRIRYVRLPSFSILVRLPILCSLVGKPVVTLIFSCRCPSFYKTVCCHPFLILLLLLLIRLRILSTRGILFMPCPKCTSYLLTLEAGIPLEEIRLPVPLSRHFRWLQ